MAEPRELPVCGWEHKVRHPSRRLAVEAMRVQLRTILIRRKQDRPRLEVYLCRVCGGYHIGNSRPWVGDGRWLKRKPEPTVKDFEGE